jgi:hypothetical protein
VREGGEKIESTVQCSVVWGIRFRKLDASFSEIDVPLNF